MHLGITDRLSLSRFVLFVRGVRNTESCFLEERMFLEAFCQARGVAKKEDQFHISASAKLFNITSSLAC